jgi:hypothetical protein
MFKLVQESSSLRVARGRFAAGQRPIPMRSGAWTRAVAPLPQTSLIAIVAGTAAPPLRTYAPSRGNAIIIGPASGPPPCARIVSRHRLPMPGGGAFAPVRRFLSHLLSNRMPPATWA